jgi:hypothetical protein
MNKNRYWYSKLHLKLQNGFNDLCIQTFSCLNSQSEEEQFKVLNFKENDIYWTFRIFSNMIIIKCFKYTECTFTKLQSLDIYNVFKLSNTLIILNTFYTESF